MAVDLIRFYILWSIILLMLTSLACLVFMELPEYHYFSTALNMHFEFALGAFDSGIYCMEELPPEICLEGRIFMFVFNSLNVVLLLNLIIAIMGSIYGMFEDKMACLYYQVLISKFATMEYDDRYGASACASPPLNLMIVPF